MHINFQLSTKLLQDGRHEELDHVMAEKEEEFRREREAKEAELDAEEAEHTKSISQSLDEEHVEQLKAKHKQLLNSVSNWCCSFTHFFLFFYCSTINKQLSLRMF